MILNRAAAAAASLASAAPRRPLPILFTQTFHHRCEEWKQWLRFGRRGANKRDVTDIAAAAARPQHERLLPSLIRLYNTGRD